MNDNESLFFRNQDSAGGTKIVKKKFMILSLGESRFAIPLSQVREVIATTQLTELPNMPQFFAGVINLRGKIISTVFLKKSLKSIKATDHHIIPKKPCIVITDIQGQSFGAHVDDVTEVVSVHENQIDVTMNEDIETREVYLGIIKFENHLLAPILNMEKALRIDELKRKEILKKVA